jgi:Concanavalin A-like lectin/glucanases superfamily
MALNQPTLPPEGSFTDPELNFIDESPPGFFPENQDSNWGYRRKVFSDQVQDLYNQLFLIFSERFPQTSEFYLDEWERMVGLPPAPDALTYAEVVLLDGPKLFLRLGDESGTAAVDSSGLGHNGVYHGGFSLAQPGAIEEDADGSIFLDGGASTNITVADHNDLDVTDDFSIELWVKLLGLPAGNSYLLDKGTNGYALRFATGGSSAFTLRKSGVADVVTSTQEIPVDGSFHHVVVTKIAGAVAMYLDNEIVTGTVSNQTFANTASALYIGSINGGGTTFTGYLDELSIYNFALSPNAVLARFQAGHGFSRANLGNRRASVLRRIRKGAFTRARRIEIVESYINATFGHPVELTEEGVALTPSGIPLHDELADISTLYNIVEDVEDFSYDVRILASVAIDTEGLLRDLKYMTPAGITFTLTLVGSSQGLTVPFTPPATPAVGLFHS